MDPHSSSEDSAKATTTWQSSSRETTTTSEASNGESSSTTIAQSNGQNGVRSKTLFETPAQLLGIIFLKNERKGFDSEVQRTMQYLLEQASETSQVNGNGEEESSSGPQVGNLVETRLAIPNSLQELVEIELDISDSARLERLLAAFRANNQKILNENSVIDGTLWAEPIRVPAHQLFLYRGPLNSPVERCLALTTAFPHHLVPSGNAGGDTASQYQSYQQCYFLYLESPAKITEIVDVFRKLHGITSHSPVSNPPNVTTRPLEFKVVLNAEVEIQEEVSEGKWQTCQREKESFKLRTNLDKKICITLQQDMTNFHYPMVRVERCFGILLSPGRNLASHNMVAIGLNSMSASSVIGSANQLQWQIFATWVPSELNFDYLNTETPRDTRVYFTIALDLVIESIEEPVRFVFEAKAKIVPPAHSMAATATEKFWHNFTNKAPKQQQEQFTLMVRQKPDSTSPGGRMKFEVLSCLSATQIALHNQRLTLQLNHNKMAESAGVVSPDSIETPSIAEELEEGDDEPLPSGTGQVSKECSQSELKGWKEILDKWNTNLNVRPRLLSSYVRYGVPQALRPEVWQLLSQSHEIEEKIVQSYKALVAQNSSHEAIILRDISRTFPAHEKFRDSSSTEQEALFRICKAYSNYDQEIGYCQGLSFLVAALLLNMPEEQAFCVLIRIMYSYGLRDLYKSGLEELHCKFYQLERLLDDHMQELYLHFLDLNIETHMYASQWFLTLFTTKFPLNVVFLIIDLFLLDKMDTLLQIALALLKMSKNDLLALDFEGVMKYFRVTLPKKYRSDENARELIRTATKINVKKSKKYEKEYRAWQEEERQRLNPLEALEKENKRLMLTTMRLEQENDDLSQELLSTCNSKIKLLADLDRAEDKGETLNTMLLQTRSQLVDVEEERRQLEEELKNLKDMCRKEIDRYESELRNSRKIIEEYKQICKNYQNRFESEQQKSQSQLSEITNTIKSCGQCSVAVANVLTQHNGRGDQVTGVAVNSTGDTNGPSDTSSSDQAKEAMFKKITDLESELIKTKVALAEAEDRNGQLVGRLHLTNSELNLLRAQTDEAAQNRSNTWLSKTLTTIRDATKAKAGGSTGSGQVESGGEPANSIKVRRSSSRDLAH